MRERSDLWGEFAGERERICGPILRRIRERRPLVHLLTNYVTVTDCVNALLAVGAHGICSHAPEEAAEVTRGADALVCNLGGTEYYDAMRYSAEAALEIGIPLVIDPVGCSASAHRRAMCLTLIRQCRPAAVRGNYAEIRALIRGYSDDVGLDSAGTLSEREEKRLEEEMQEFSARTGVMLIASGASDLCTDGHAFAEVHSGTPALRRITGAGCLSTALLAAFLAEENTLEAACSATAFVGTAGEAAWQACLRTGTGAGHFHMFLMDALSSADPIWETGDSETSESENER